MVEKLTNEKINMYPQLDNVMDYNLDSTRLRKRKTILLLKCVKEEQWVKHLIDKNATFDCADKTLLFLPAKIF